MSDIKDFVIKKGVLHNYTGEEENVVVPDGVTNISKFAFYYRKSLITSIAIPDSVTTICEDAFYDCKRLKTVVLPKNVTSFEGSALELIWNYFNKPEYKNFMVIWFVKQLPELIRSDANLGKKVKANKKIILNYAIENDDAEAMEVLFSLYSKIKLDDINAYIEVANSAINVKTFLLNYKDKLYTVENQEKHVNDKLDKALGIKERTITEWKKIYNFDVNGKNATITGYKGTDTNVVIPKLMGNYKVVAIGDEAFSIWASGIRKEIKESREKIETIVIPDSITSIGDAAFYNCKNLTSITIPDSVMNIGEKAFNECEKLESINLPVKLKGISGFMFSGCTSLTSVTIPEGVTRIEKNAFAFCKKLKNLEIDFSRVIVENDAFGWCDSLTDKNGFFIKGNRLYSVRSDIKEYSVPEGIKILDDNALSWKRVNNLNPEYHELSERALRNYFETERIIKIPSYITSIPDGQSKSGFSGNSYYSGCFSVNENLQEVYFTSTMKRIGSYAFARCKNLKEVSLNEGLTEISQGAFMKTGLRIINIPSTVSQIDTETFVGCSELAVVYINEGVKKICERAFADCSALREIYIPSSVTEISDSAFSSFKNKTIYTPAGSYAEQYANKNKIKVANEKTTVGDNEISFEYKVSKNKTVKLTAYVSDSADVVIPSVVENCPVTDFSKDIFKNNKMIISVEWPGEISTLPKEIFFGCTALEKVVFADGVAAISEKAFRNCVALKSIYIPSSVTDIHEKAFECAQNTMYGWKYWTCVEIIHAPTGSYAEKYAKENNIKFVAE